VDKDAFIRRALWLSVPFNVAGAILFAFPSSCLSQYFGLPTPVPALYSTVLAFNILLAGGMYACIARQPKIDRPLVKLAVIGKTGFFLFMVVFWLLGHVPGQAVLAASGDLAFGVIFAWWLFSTKGRAA
jgi:hypothetical protein